MKASTSFSAIDYQHMAEAIGLAKQGRFTAHPNPCVGCVIAINDKVIGKGFHQKTGQAHAEIKALDNVYASAVQSTELANATAYVTLEPCFHTGRTAPCVDALIKAKIQRVVIAQLDPNPLVAGKSVTKLEQAGIVVEVGLLQAQAEQLNPGFLQRMRFNKPYLRVKMASSLDGASAMESGESKWITGSDARADVQKYRAQSAAILSTAKTVLADNAKLNVRFDSLVGSSEAITLALKQQRQPIRVILDNHAILSTTESLSSLDLFRQAGDILLISQSTDKGAGNNIEQQQLLIDAFVKNNPAIKANIKLVAITSSLSKSSKLIDLPVLMAYLATIEINDIWVEAGANLVGSLLRHQLVDEFILYMAPLFCGEATRSVLDNTGIVRLCDAKKFQITDNVMVGKDIRLTLKPVS